MCRPPINSMLSVYFLPLCAWSLVFAQSNSYRGDPAFNVLLTDLWAVDPNKLLLDTELILNWQGSVQFHGPMIDRADQPLCTTKSKKISNSEVYTAFIALMNNYDSPVGITERETPQELQEINTFLNAILSTETMRKIHRYLIGQKLSKASPELFKKQLFDIWFKMFRRWSPNDSSAFEHTFIGETKENTVLGAHNWLTFCLKEKNGKINYQGHFAPRRGDPDFKRAVRFIENGKFQKAIGSMLFGSSIEFELGLYTVAYLQSLKQFGYQSNWGTIPVKIGDANINIQCHQHHQNMGSCYVK